MKFIFFSCFTFLFFHLQAQDFSALFEELDESVVTLEVAEFKLQDQQISSSSSLGSGVIIDAEGLIFTAAHVVEFANEITVKIKDKGSYMADVLSNSTFADVALIKLRKPPANLKAVRIGDSDKAKIGEQVLIIGAPLGLEHSLSVGHISRKMNKGMITNGEPAGFIQTDASINQGNSGGPMFNTKGELIGIVSFILSQSGGFEGLGFAVDINTAQKTTFNVSSFWAGFEGFFMSEGIAAVLNTPQKSGVLIQRVSPDSFADKLGLRPGYVQGEIFGQKLWLGGDIILSMQGSSCNEPHDLSNIRHQIEHLVAGDKVTVKILRAGKVIDLESQVK